MRQCLAIANWAALALAPASAFEAPQITGAFIAISAADAPKLATWYEANLGFETLLAGQTPDGQTRYALLTLGATQIEIIERKDSRAPMPAANGKREAYRTQGYFKAGFIVNDIDALEARLKTKGAEFSRGVVQPSGNPYRTFAVYDPEGNVLQVFGK